MSTKPNIQQPFKSLESAMKHQKVSKIESEDIYNVIEDSINKKKILHVLWFPQKY